MLKTRQLHIVKETFGGSKDEPWGYYFWEDNEKPRHVYTAFCYKRGHATTVCAKDLDVHVKCEACAELDQDDGGIMTGLSGMVKDVQFDDDEATQFVLNFKSQHKYMPFKDEVFLKALDNLIAKRDNKVIIEEDNNKMIIEADNKKDDEFFKKLSEPTIDWNIWHDAFMNAYEQIDFVKCAKAILYYKSLSCETSKIKDPDSNEEVDKMVCKLKESVNSNTKRAVESLMSPDYKSEPCSNFSSGHVGVTAWKSVEGEEAAINIQIYLFNTILSF